MIAVSILGSPDAKLWRSVAAPRRTDRHHSGNPLPTTSTNPAPASSGDAPLNAGEFAREFEGSARVLWCIAAGVLGDRERARDVVQDSAIIGLRKLREYRRGTSFVHWMGQIVRYTALNESRRRRGFTSSDPSSLPEPEARVPVRASLGFSPEEFDDRTMAALNALEETPRLCLLMRTVLELTYQQIAEALDIPEGTAMSHVHRARQRVRAALVFADRQGGRR